MKSIYSDLSSGSFNSANSFVTIDYTSGSSDTEDQHSATTHADVVQQNRAPEKFTKVIRHSSPVNKRNNRSHSRDSYINSDPQVIYGRGHSTRIRAVPKDINVLHQRNAAITGVFVSRLDPKTTSSDLQMLIRQETGLRVKPQKMRTKSTLYSSFYIEANKSSRDLILHPDVWPKYTLLKPFYGSLRF